METLELFTKEPMCRRAQCLKKKSKYIEGNHGGTHT
jgi:hypothetical protein